MTGGGDYRSDSDDGSRKAHGSVGWLSSSRLLKRRSDTDVDGTVQTIADCFGKKLG
jgi:hypothetical protein